MYFECIQIELYCAEWISCGLGVEDEFKYLS